MAVVATSITKGLTTVATSATTASVTPVANRLYLLTVNSRHASLDPTVPTVSGGGLTWVQIATDSYDNSGSQKRITMFRALGASPSTGALTIDFAGQSQSDIEWTLDEFTGMDTTGTNGSGAIVQSVVNQDRTGTGTTLSATLAAFGNVNNATYAGCVVGNSAITFTPSTGMTAITTENPAANICTLSEFKNSNNTTPGFTSSLAGELGIIAVEIKAAATTTTKTQTGISRITQVTPKTQTGKANAIWDKTTQYDHVVVVIMENQNYTDIIGNATDAPYINNTLLPVSALLSNYFALDHPSEPNYLALISGSEQGEGGDTDPNIGPPDNLALKTGTNLVDRMESASVSWKAYMEAMPSDWYTKAGRTMGDTGGADFSGNQQYQEHHNPFVYFSSNNNTNSNTRLTKIVPYTQLATDLAVAGGSGLPKFSWITPQIDHDMHDPINGSTTAIRSGDNWLSTAIPAILTSDAFTKQRGLLILLWDEDNNATNKVPCILTGFNVRKNITSSNRYDHYTTLRTIEAALGHLTPMQTDATKNSDLTATIFSDVFLTSKDQTGVARIALVTTKTQTGKSRITSVVAKLQSAVANIKNNTLRLQTAVARIQKVSGSIIDQQQTNKPNGFNLGDGTTLKQAQSFKPSVTNYLSKLVLNLNIEGVPSDQVQCQIYSNNSGVPGSLLKTADNTVSVDGTDKTFTFTSGLLLTASTTYWIVVSRTGSQDAVNFYDILGTDQNSDAYTNGQLLRYDGVNWGTNDVTPGFFVDAYFIEYYQPTLIQGKANLVKNTLQTITGISRITDITQRLQTAKSRITNTASKTITGVSRITVTVSRTIAGVSRVIQTTLKTQTGKARVTAATLKTQTGVAHINAVGVTTTTKTQSAIARITATVLRLQTAKASIAVTTNRVMAAVARLIYTTTRTITGKANITASSSRLKTITGVANIQKSLVPSTGWSAVTIPTTIWTKP